MRKEKWHSGFDKQGWAGCASSYSNEKGKGKKFGGKPYSQASAEVNFPVWLRSCKHLLKSPSSGVTHPVIDTLTFPVSSRKGWNSTQGPHISFLILLLLQNIFPWAILILVPWVSTQSRISEDRRFSECHHTSLFLSPLQTATLLQIIHLTTPVPLLTTLSGPTLHWNDCFLGAPSAQTCMFWEICWDKLSP
jgi:hypothetical protein